MMNSLEVLASLIVFDPRDWSRYRSDALIYGIVVGWDEPAAKDIAARFKLNQEFMATLHALHLDYRERMQ